MPQKVDYVALANEVRGGSAPTPAAKVDYAALAEQSRTLYDPSRHPASAEDFTEKSTPKEFSKGVLKGATSSLAGLGEMLANAGMLPGVLPNAFGPEEMRNPTFRRVEEATTATNAAQRAGKTAEFVAEIAAPTYQLGKAGIALAKAAPKLAPMAVEVASHIPVIGGPVRLARGAAKILGHVLDLAPQASNKGGKLVTSSAASIEDDLARALEDMRRPDLPESVELPPPAELPPGYVPRSVAPEPPAPANAGGRLVRPRTPTTEQALADALKDVRTAQPPARVTTAPEASLPPGYTPRTTAPKPKLVKPERSPTPPTTQPARRAYFLKSPEELAAVADETVTPSGSITTGDLPASWQSHTGQDIFPITGAEGQAVIDGMRAELKARGLSVGEAIASVSKNKAIPVQIRTQLLRALSGGR